MERRAKEHKEKEERLAQSKHEEQQRHKAKMEEEMIKARQGCPNA